MRHAQTLTVGDDLYVIPDAAQPYLAADRLDRQLFNVTGLIEQGYDDAPRRGAAADRGVRRRPAPAALRAERLPASDKVRDLASINAAALERRQGRSGPVLGST